MHLTQNELLAKIYESLPPGHNEQFLKLCTSNPRKGACYIALYYYVHKFPDKLIGYENDVYDAYFYWADGAPDYDIASKHMFTRYLRKQGYFLRTTNRDGVLGRMYVKPDKCPACERPFDNI